MTCCASRRFGGALLAAFAASLAVFVLLVFVSLFLQLVQERPAQVAGRLLLPLPLGLIVTAALAGRWRAVVLPVVLGLLLGGAGLLVLGLRLREDLGATELGTLLAVIGAGVGLTTAPVVSVALGSPVRIGPAWPRPGSTWPGSSAASSRSPGSGPSRWPGCPPSWPRPWRAAGSPPSTAPRSLDALLGARNDEVRPLLLQGVGVVRTLRLREALSDAATASFVSSTGMVLVVAGIVLLALAVGERLAAQPRDPPAVLSWTWADDAGEHVGVGLRQHAVPQVEHVALGGAALRQGPLGHRADDLPRGEHQRRVEVALDRLAGTDPRTASSSGTRKSTPDDVRPGLAHVVQQLPGADAEVDARHVRRRRPGSARSAAGRARGSPARAARRPRSRTAAPRSRRRRSAPAGRPA